MVENKAQFQTERSFDTFGISKQKMKFAAMKGIGISVFTFLD